MSDNYYKIHLISTKKTALGFVYEACGRNVVDALHSDIVSPSDFERADSDDRCYFCSKRYALIKAKAARVEAARLAKQI